MRTIIMIAMAAMVSGCALTDKWLTNRLAVTLSSDECRVDSRWLAFGISTALDKRDCAVILEAARSAASRR